MAKVICAMSTIWGIFAFLAAACVAAAPQCAQAQSGSNIAATGQKLAQQYCSECHAIAPNARGNWTDAPAFDAIANRPDTTAAKLSAFIQQEHAHMLNTARPRGEADAIAAYIISLRQS